MAILSITKIFLTLFQVFKCELYAALQPLIVITRLLRSLKAAEDPDQSSEKVSYSTILLL